MPPVPPVTDEPEPPIAKWLTPDPEAPKSVVAAAEVIVSFGAAKTVAGLVVVMLLLPDDVSATAEPETVSEDPGLRLRPSRSRSSNRSRR